MTLLWGDTFRTSAANSSACWRCLAKDASNGSCEKPFHLDFPRLRFTSTCFTSYIKCTSENFREHIICQVIHQLVHRLKSFATVWASRNNNAAAPFRNRRRLVYESAQTVFHQLSFRRA